ncbi:MAG: hypothetical protein Tsb002_15990 [Wenzhouxiangellaceae bacterium]
MRLLFQINSGPDKTPAANALADAHSLTADGAQLAAVFFYFNGVNHAAPGMAGQTQWLRLSQQLDCPLILCQSAWQRRHDGLPVAGFQRGSLTDLVVWLERVDKVCCYGSGGGG